MSDDIEDDDDTGTDVTEVLAMLADKMSGKEKEYAAPKLQIEKLYEAAALFAKPTTLKVGDIVRGIELLTKGRLRGWDQPHMVMKILDTPLRLVFDPESIGHDSGAKPYNAIVAQYVKGGISRYYIDLAEFEKYPGAEKFTRKAD